ncbi:MAG: putative DNA-binding domain-containing protein [Rhodanobacter sp.]
MHTAPTLTELQGRFLDALYDDSDAGPIEEIAGNGLEPPARLRIYRHSCNQIQSAALRAAYPAALALVGAAFFEQTARGYRHARPSASGNLQGFGAGFADYLASLSSLAGYPYLPDVARLEWRRQLAVLAADADTIDTDTPVEMTGTAFHRQHVQLHPSVQLLRSRYAVMTLWRWCLAPSATAPPVDEGEQVLLWRDGVEVAMAVLAPATFRCVELLADGHDVATARAAACSVDNEFDFASCLGDLLAQGLIVTFTDEEISP